MSHLPISTQQERARHLRASEPLSARALVSVPRTTFLGRERELETVQRLLRNDVAVVTLTGPGGVGKTRLAMQAASELAAEYPDGVIVVDLSPIRDAAQVLPRIAQDVGVTDTGRRGIGEALIAVLRSRQALLVLDNCEQVLDAMPHIASLVSACPALQVLATSRAMLRLYGEHAVPIHPLPLPVSTDLPTETLLQYAAIQLFIDRARAVLPAFSPVERDIRAIAAICQTLDGLPLAIELAATRAQLFTPEAILAHLSNRLDILVDGPRDRPARQRTLRDTIAWSYDLLGNDERGLFRALSTFVGGFDLDAARAIVGAEPADVLHRLGALVEQCLVTRIPDTKNGDRFGLLETTREFAWDQFRAHDEVDVTRHRHATHYLSLAEQAEAHIYGPEMHHGLDRLEAEYPNCRAALQYFIGVGDRTSELRLAAKMSEFWSYRGRIREGIEVLHDAVSRDGTALPGPLSNAMAKLAFLYWTDGDRDRALRCSADALPPARQHKDPYRLAQALFIRASTLAGEGENHEETISLLEEGREIIEVHDPKLEIFPVLLADLGWAWLRAGEEEKGLTLIRQAIPESRREGRHHQLGWTFLRLGRLDRLEGRPQAAARHYAESLRAFRDAGLVTQIGFPLAELGELLLETGHGDVAKRFAGTIRKIHEETGATFDDDPVGPPFPKRQGSGSAPGAFGIDAQAGPPLPLADAVSEAIAAAEALAEGRGPHSPAAPPRQQEAIKLTDRERDVLALLTQRYTAPEIADQLFISVRTVERHVSNVYNKMGVSSRRAAASIAVQHGLV